MAEVVSVPQRGAGGQLARPEDPTAKGSHLVGIEPELTLLGEAALLSQIFVHSSMPMPMPALRSLCSLAVTAALLVACASIEDHPSAKPIAPMPGLGSSTFAVTARDEQARAQFAQRLLLTDAFEHEEAARVFRAALERDPGCAMCAWGVAYSFGPDINN